MIDVRQQLTDMIAALTEKLSEFEDAIDGGEADLRQLRADRDEIRAQRADLNRVLGLRAERKGAETDGSDSSDANQTAE